MTDKVFLTARNDGLGERLKALLNAMVLAEFFGVDFKFQWRLNPTLRTQHHCIESKLVTFTPEFLTDHDLPHFDRTDYPVLLPVRASQDAVRAALAGAPGGLLVNQEPLDNLIDFANEIPPSAYRDAFERIGFSTLLMDAMAAARSAAIPATSVALHLRAGDIVYGDFRMVGTLNQKALCYPLAKAFILQLLDMGKYPLVFGQDMTTCRLLARTAGLRLARDYLPPTWSSLAEALAEIVLMARCHEIYAGVSGFSRVAALIGEGELLTPLDVAEPSDLIDVIVAEPDLYNEDIALPALQKAFAFATVVALGEGVVASQSLIEALDYALIHDPDNAYYSLMKARFETDTGDIMAAEATLSGMLERVDRTVDFRDTPLRRVIKHTYRGVSSSGRRMLRAYLDKLRFCRDRELAATRAVGAIATRALNRGEHFEDEIAARAERVAQRQGSTPEAVDVVA